MTQVQDFLIIPEIAAIVFEPITWILTILSNITFDLEGIAVVCSGSQAPFELMLNIIILGVAVLIIESGYQDYKAVTNAALVKKFFSIASQPFYKKWMSTEMGTQENKTYIGFFMWIFVAFEISFAMGLANFDFFRSGLQFLMSYVNLAIFAEDGWHHPFSESCNSIVDYEGFDEALAIFSSLLAYFLLMPAVYEVSKVRCIDNFMLCLDLGLGIYFSILLLSCLMWSAALDSSDLLLSYSITSLA